MTDEQRKELDRIIDGYGADAVLPVLTGEITEPTSLHLAICMMLGRAGAYGDLSSHAMIRDARIGVRGQMIKHTRIRKLLPTPPVEG